MRRLHWVFFLPVFAGPVSTQDSNAASCTDASYRWSYNSLNQSPCDLTTSLEATCSGRRNPMVPISAGWTYPGPYAGEDDLCQCSTVVYSLVSACAGCQGTTWISWSQWTYNCSSVSPHSTYLFPIPNGTRVPHWAYLDVTLSNSWNASAARIAGDSPEGTPPGASSSLNQNKAHLKTIVGAIVGAIVGVSLLIAIIFWYLRRRRSREEAQSITPTVNEVLVNANPIPFSVNPPQTETSPTSSAGHPAYTEVQPARNSDGIVDSAMSIGKYYDPSDPSTFPRPLVLPSASGIQTMHTRRNDGSTDSTHRLQYSGLPLV